MVGIASSLFQFLGSLPVTQMLVAITITLFVTFIYFNTRYLGTWSSLGVPGPKPIPIINNMLDMKNGIEEAFNKWFDTYGDNVGVYGIAPMKPCLVTKDLEICRQVLIKDFDNFVDRPRHIPWTTTPIQITLAQTLGDHWRRERRIISTFFTGSKLKVVLKHANTSAENLTNLIKRFSEEKKLVPIHRLAGKFALDVVERSAFGRYAGEMVEEENNFERLVEGLVAKHSKLEKCLLFVCMYFPRFYYVGKCLGINLDLFDPDILESIKNILMKTIEERENEKVNKKDDTVRERDMLDMFLASCVPEDDPSLSNPNSRCLTLQEAVYNSILLLLGGVDTISSGLQSIIYAITIYPEIQEKLIDEVDTMSPKGSQIDYDVISDMKYMDWVISETLRMYPPVSLLYREAKETRKYGNVTIPKGACVHFPVRHILNDPKLWENPEEFIPERFSPERKSETDAVAFMPFGIGPRMCVGMRMGVLQLKVVLVHLLREMKFELSERTEPKKGEKLEMKNMSDPSFTFSKHVKVEAVIRE